MGSTMAYYYTVSDGQYLVDFDEKAFLYCYHAAMLYPEVAWEAGFSPE